MAFRYAGLFLVSLTTLLHQILLTRIFSVTMYYHFAFVAISLTMFGLTVGAILVFLFPSLFREEKTDFHMAASALLFGVSSGLSVLTHMCIPFVTDPSLVSLYGLTLNYLCLAVPFVFSGICITLALTRFADSVSLLYAADLAGAACGCVAAIWVLEITDGPTAVFFAGLLAAVASLFFGANTQRSRLAWTAGVVCVLLAVLVTGSTIRLHQQNPLISFLWSKGRRAPQVEYQRWNAFSRVAVEPEVDLPFGWGLSSRYPSSKNVEQRWLTIDSGVGTPLTRFDGDLEKVTHLKHDVTNIAHYLRADADILVIGSGGGRDLLTALVFDQKSVLGVEINNAIIHTVHEHYGDFTGHLDHDPRVSVIHDEARSFVHRTQKTFDIIQISLIDTFAASAAGAFVLAEHSLYTIEAWKAFLARLSSQGILSVSRWYTPEGIGETHRLLALAGASLRKAGAENPRNHLVCIVNVRPKYREHQGPVGISTVLVSKSPFTEKDMELLEQLAREMDFEILVSPRGASDPLLADLAGGTLSQEKEVSLPYQLSPPTDDKPFFFQMLKLSSVFTRAFSHSSGAKAVEVLTALLVIVTGLTLICIYAPLRLSAIGRRAKGASLLTLYFLSIGLGFMLIEIAVMQRLVIFLGHPTYSLSVVLSTLLCATGLGSLFTQRVSNKSFTTWRNMLLGLLLVQLIVGSLTPLVVQEFISAATPVRIAISVGLLLTQGFFLGFCFPFGMKLGYRRTPTLTPWLWGINGAASVCGSVVAMAISLFLGIAFTFWIGVGCYFLAFLVFQIEISKGR